MYDSFLMQYYVSGTIFIVLVVLTVFYFILSQKWETRTLLLEKEKLQLELLNRELEIGFEERELLMTEVAREVHDNISQTIHFLRMNLHAAEEAELNQDARKLIGSCGHVTDVLINDVNHLSHSMNSDSLKGWGLIGSLEYDIEHINLSKNVRCYIDCEGDELLLSNEKQLMVYRIAQQAINNSLKHAKPYTIIVRLVFKPDLFRMTIKDDGVGFVVEEGLKKGRMGLANMKQRAGLLNGKIRFSSVLDKGSEVELTLRPGLMRGEKHEEKLSGMNFRPY